MVLRQASRLQQERLDSPPKRFQVPCRLTYLEVAVHDLVVLGLGGFQSSFQGRHIRLQVVHAPRLPLVAAEDLQRLSISPHPQHPCTQLHPILNEPGQRPPASLWLQARSTQ